MENEAYDRLTRKDFWNDPGRWDGIDDPRETMIWEVRRRDVIDARPPIVAPKLSPSPYANYANAAQQTQYYQSPLQNQLAQYQMGLLNQRPRPQSLFGFLNL